MRFMPMMNVCKRLTKKGNQWTTDVFMCAQNSLKDMDNNN